MFQHEGHNIFSHLNSSEYKKVLGVIKDCILSTDLATFFGNKAKLNTVVANNQFSWENNDHRYINYFYISPKCILWFLRKRNKKLQYFLYENIFNSSTFLNLEADLLSCGPNLSLDSLVTTFFYLETGESIWEFIKLSLS